MLSNTSQFHWPVVPSNDATFKEAADSVFWLLWDTNNTDNRRSEILEYARKMRQILRFPRRPEIKIKFVDYDNTLSDDSRRFAICEELVDNRWDLAYPVIQRKFGTNWSNGFKEYIELLDPKNHLLDYSKFYDPTNPHHIILTAGAEELQRLKIEKSWFTNAQYIIVDKAHKKIRAIIDYLMVLGYLPWSFEFIDDKIGDFKDIDTRLSELLDIDVTFYQAIPQPDKSVKLVKVTQVVQSKVNELLRA